MRVVACPVSDDGNAKQKKSPGWPQLPYESIGLKPCVAVTRTYWKTRGSVALVKGFVLPAHGLASGPGGHAVPVGVLSAQVQTLVTVGVAPDGNRPRLVKVAAVTLGSALATWAPARAALSREAALPMRTPYSATPSPKRTSTGAAIANSIAAAPSTARKPRHHRLATADLFCFIDDLTP